LNCRKLTANLYSPTVFNQMNKKLYINIDSHFWECGDECCTDLWDTITINGEEVSGRFHSADAESIEAVLNYLGVEHDFIHVPYSAEIHK